MPNFQELLLQRHRQAMGAAVNASDCSGCHPDTQREAYALLWGGTVTNVTRYPPHPAAMLSGLRAAVRSIRRQDSMRTIILLVVDPQARQFPPLVEMQQRFSPLRIELVAALHARTLPNKLCHKSMKRKTHQAGRVRLRSNHVLMRSNGTRAMEPISTTVAPEPINGSDDWRGGVHSGYIASVRPLSVLQMFTKFRVWGLGALCGAHGNFTRVLYMDTDVMVTRPLAPLWNLTFQRHEVAAGVLTLQNLGSLVREPSCASFERRAGANSPQLQLNAGVLLLRPTARIYAVLLAGLHMPINFDCSGGDQTAFNMLLVGHLRCVGHTFNCYDPYFLRGVAGAQLAAYDAQLIHREQAQQRWKHLDRLNNWSEVRRWRALASSPSGGTECRSYTCAVLRDLHGGRTRCLDTELQQGDRPKTKAQRHEAATMEFRELRMGQAMAEKAATERAAAERAAAVSPDGDRPSLSTGYAGESDAALPALVGMRHGELPLPHIVHFMSGLKPWLEDNRHLRRNSRIFRMWATFDREAGGAGGEDRQ